MSVTLWIIAYLCVSYVVTFIASAYVQRVDRTPAGRIIAAWIVILAPVSWWYALIEAGTTFLRGNVIERFGELIEMSGRHLFGDRSI